MKNDVGFYLLPFRVISCQIKLMPCDCWSCRCQRFADPHPRAPFHNIFFLLSQSHLLTCFDGGKSELDTGASSKNIFFASAWHSGDKNRHNVLPPTLVSIRFSWDSIKKREAKSMHTPHPKAIKNYLKTFLVPIALVQPTNTRILISLFAAHSTLSVSWLIPVAGSASSAFVSQQQFLSSTENLGKK